MKTENQSIHKQLLRPISIVMMAGIMIASYPVQSFSAGNTNISSTISTKKLAYHSQGTYKSDRFRFQFNYSPKDFVVNYQTSRRSSDVNLATVDIWTKQHAQRIKAGVYEGGTEYPANVQVNVYKNSQRFPLLTWIQQSQQFPADRQFKTVKIAGRNAIQFQASGLYENTHIAVINPKNSQIIIVTLSQIGSGNNDAIYRKAYEQVLKSLKFI
ncbi:hypothetical protein H6G73_07280 [Richelia sinica FACHB-800]|nr:hypothetical protein [Richelia sinica FACHB-800]